MSKRYEPVEGTVTKTTDAAVLIEQKDGDEVWVPRSVCEDGDDLDEGDTDVRVQRWFAEKEGLSA